MTNEEAIKHINVVKSRIRGGDEAYDLQRKEALNIAIEALEKQVPKKPKIYEWDKEMRRYTECCPTCGDTWNLNEFGEGMKFCWECGQRIDWSDDE